MSQDRGSDQVRVVVEGAVGRITLAAPDRLNAVDAAMLFAVADAVRRLDADPAVRVIALTGEGRGFCAGADLGSGTDLAGQVDSSTLDGAGDAVRALTGSATPTVALVNGVAAGVGVSLAIACDYVVASEAASFVLAFARIGLMPDGGATALVAASIGRAKAMRMALTGEKVDATTAERWGLVAECVPADGFVDRGEALLAQLAASAPAAAAATTSAINAATLDLASALTIEERDQLRLLASADFREGVAAFQEKRPARFGDQG